MTENKTAPVATGASYREAGVDIEAGDKAVEGLKSKIRRATRPEVVGGIGGFAGLFALDTQKYRKPLLASSTDGVGTKLVIAQRMGIHDTVGIDLVAMVVDDLVVCGAEPLFLLDYIACGKVVPERIADLGAGIADGCRYASCALIGGEIAEHPGVLGADEYDVSATGVGAVEADAVLGPEKVAAGDVVIGMAASGLHSNGFSLVRHVLLGEDGMSLDTVVPEFGNQRTLGEELLTPTKIYARDCLAIIEECEVHAFSHITGGGVPGNLVRSIPSTVDAVVDRGSWRPQPVFDLVARSGGIAAEEMERTFNMGMGMAAIVPADQVDRTMALLTARGTDSWVAGRIEPGRGEVKLTGEYSS
ncbi:phosphoribosylformylglycinamidine cyclo-ligase [Stackebrandtia nassauensis]|uniref:Phosphoribosylformylglycinamidine cyclo-ligase n=1 Tax=Stackebrandtia nassauensis (strain DSM 44728 / CIP 108903 / NRRL B-16338 / NBRC 102104 / LLR-40K-21) TaxID=446470 RepID=D3Q2L3_STANL|nr:phosphoribosylformylglycinamidine cyclo-ligase [Stackebrandtia nassauensis]ADD45764.1 phosphoribosylformylglycinamidine cyclo-ligase [Stackebrandtia nassauensis DSM 44728]